MRLTDAWRRYVQRQAASGPVPSGSEKVGRHRARARISGRWHALRCSCREAAGVEGGRCADRRVLVRGTKAAGC